MTIKKCLCMKLWKEKRDSDRRRRSKRKRMYEKRKKKEGTEELSSILCNTQGSDPDLPHYRRILYQLSHQGIPRILEWVAYAFSKGSSQPRNWTGVSCIAGGFFTSWVTREAQAGLFQSQRVGHDLVTEQQQRIAGERAPGVEGRVAI